MRYDQQDICAKFRLIYQQRAALFLSTAGITSHTTPAASGDNNYGNTGISTENPNDEDSRAFTSDETETIVANAGRALFRRMQDENYPSKERAVPPVDIKITADQFHELHGWGKASTLTKRTVHADDIVDRGQVPTYKNENKDVGNPKEGKGVSIRIDGMDVNTLGKDHNPTATATHSNIIPSCTISFNCTKCGHPTFPFQRQLEHSSQKTYTHFAKIRLRRVKRGKTRRRRASRCVAKEYARQSRLLHQHNPPKRRGRITHTHHTSKSTTPLASYYHTHVQEQVKNYHKMRRVRDGTSRHAIVYTCGHCGDKRHFKGFPVSTKRRNNDITHPGGVRKSGSVGKVVDDDGHDEKDYSRVYKQKIQISAENYQNVISTQKPSKSKKRNELSSHTQFLKDVTVTCTGKTPSSNVASTSGKNDTITNIMALSHNKKKNRKLLQKKKGVKSELSHFLSSLND